MFQSIIKKIVLLLSLLLLSQVSVAQTKAQYKELALADSLGQTHNFEKAHALADRLLESVDDKAIESQRFLLEVQQTKAQIFEKQDRLKESIELCLSVIGDGEKLGHVKVLCATQLTLALIHEKLKDFDRCAEALTAAEQMISKHNLVANYAHYCIRKSSYFRLTQQRDSSIYYAKKGFEFGNKYNQHSHSDDALLLLGHLYGKEQPFLSNKYYDIAAKRLFERTRYHDAGFMYYNISYQFQLRRLLYQPQLHLIKHHYQHFLQYYHYQLDRIDNLSHRRL